MKKVKCEKQVTKVEKVFNEHVEQISTVIRNELLKSEKKFITPPIYYVNDVKDIKGSVYIYDGEMKKLKKFVYTKENKYVFKAAKLLKSPGVNGIFEFEKIPKEVDKTGIILIKTSSIATLAHELCHAMQHQNNNKYLSKRYKVLRRILYIYFTIESEAFNFALKYLFSLKEITEVNEEWKVYCKQTEKVFALFASRVLLIVMLIIWINLKGFSINGLQDILLIFAGTIGSIIIGLRIGKVKVSKWCSSFKNNGIK